MERIAVGKRTLIDYGIRLDSFRSFLKENGLTTRTAEDVDEALVLYLTDAYLEGKPSEFGCKMLAAVQWQNPAYGRYGNLSLPPARGWHCRDGAKAPRRGSACRWRGWRPRPSPRIW